LPTFVTKALIAARYDKTAVDKQDFLDAVDRIVGFREEKQNCDSGEEKQLSMKQDTQP
jgi:cell division protease FtsH